MLMHIIFFIVLPVKMLKAFIPSSTLTTGYAHLNLIELIILTMNGTNYEVPLSLHLHSIGLNIRIRTLFSFLP